MTDADATPRKSPTERWTPRARRHVRPALEPSSFVLTRILADSRSQAR